MGNTNIPVAVFTIGIDNANFVNQLGIIEHDNLRALPPTRIWRVDTRFQNHIESLSIDLLA